MGSFIKFVRQHAVLRFDTRLVVGLTGGLLSIALHELFHVYMHWGHIASVGFFTYPSAIIEIIAYVPGEYDVELEELLAYSITLIVLVLTTIIIAKMHDHKDKRNIIEILLPNTPKHKHAQIYKQIQSYLLD